MPLISREVFFYLGLHVATTFVNKYVLSVLQFTYPTIFQGWQTLVGTLLLRGLIQSGRIHVDLSLLSRATIAPWIPAMMLFLMGIYSGSVALSRLPVPVYMALHNLTYIFLATGEVVGSGTVVTLKKYILLMVILVTVVMISWTDPQYSPVGYFWMCIHIVSVGLMSMYESIARYRIHLGDIDKMYLNYIYSLTVLVPCTYFLGDAMAATHFQFWYYYRFYAGCVLSGICGVFLTVYRVKCKEREVTENVEEVTCIGKGLTSFLSLFFFPYVVSTSNTIWVIINLTAGVLLHQEMVSTDSTTPRGYVEKEESSAFDFAVAAAASVAEGGQRRRNSECDGTEII